MGRRVCSVLLLVGILGAIPAALGQTDPSLVGWWTFDEGSGTMAHDASGHGLNGTIQGNPAWGPGKLGGALNFDGVDDQVLLPALLPIGSSSCTVAAWIKVPRVGTGGLSASTRVGILLGNYNDSPNCNWELHAVGEMRMYWNGGQVDAHGKTDLRDNTWHHIAWVRDKTANGFFLYIDGRVDLQTTTVGTDVTFNTKHRIGGDNRGASPWFHGWVDDFQIYSRALSQAEIAVIMKGLGNRGAASSPTPRDGAIDIPRGSVLSWTPGPYAATHDVYVGTSAVDVNSASRADPRAVLVSQGQTGTTYTPSTALPYGQVYYWRIDEVNAAPDTTIFKGPVWRFTVEPVAYPLGAGSITAVASSSNSADEGPGKTVDGSGLAAADLHSTQKADMWLSASAPAGTPTWIQYGFDGLYVLHQMQIWNYNSELEPVVGLGIRQATIEYSVDGVTWTAWGGTYEFARASGRADYAANTTVDLGNMAARYVRITAHSNWGGVLPQYGLSEVRFLYVPMCAREPNPASGATDVDPRMPLTWRGGRGAATHAVYLSTNKQTVIDGKTPVATVTASSYAAALNLDTTYYWKINEVNAAANPGVWTGDVWSFSTRKYLVVDDFESYTDQDGNRIYQTWIDGWVNKTGAQVGYLTAPFAETQIAHSGKQSMPLTYTNAAAPGYSEAGLSFSVPQNWTAYGIRTLILYFRGQTGNTGQLYLKINDTKVLYGGDAGDIAQAVWHTWPIDLSAVGTGLASVKNLSIGIQGANAKGILYIDDIRLYPVVAGLLMPTAPSNANLVNWWKFDEGSGTTVHDSGGQGNNGTLKGAQWVSGIVGGALAFDGVANEVLLTSPLTVGSSSNTVTAWVKVPRVGTGGLTASTRVGVLLGNCGDNPNTNWELYSGGQPRLYWNGGEINSLGTTDLRDDTWHHLAWVRDKAANACYTYVDGRLEATAAKAGKDITFGTADRIGADSRMTGSPHFHGAVADLRIYSEALPQAQVAWLAGVKTPIDLK